MSDPVYILSVPRATTDEQKASLYRTSAYLPPLGHHVLIWIGDVWDIGYREERGDTWRWLLIEHEGIDYSIDYWAYLPNPPPIEVEAIRSTSVRLDPIIKDLLFPYFTYHHPRCGIDYRGCHPTLCPKDQYERTGKWIGPVPGQDDLDRLPVM